MDTVIRRLEQAAMAVAGLCVVAMMLIVCHDGVGRYLFGTPLQWAFDVVTYYLLVTAAYLALSSTYQQGDHISIGLIQAMLPRRVRVGANIVCSLLAVVLFGAIAYATGMHAVEAYQGKEFLPGIIMWPAWLSILPIPIGTALLVLRLLHHSIMLARQGDDPFVMSEGEGAME